MTRSENTQRHRWVDIGIETAGFPTYEYRCARGCGTTRIKLDFVTFHYGFVDRASKQHVETDRAPECIQREMKANG